LQQQQQNSGSSSSSENNKVTIYHVLYMCQVEFKSQAADATSVDQQL
jgi:hypothetical protein